MKTSNVVECNRKNLKNSNKCITPECLQGIFLDIAQKVGDRFLQSFRESSSVDYANRPEALNEDFFGLYDEFTQWKREIKEGYLLRILKHLGVYDGRRIHKDRLLTALIVICFIGRFSDDRNGSILSFKGRSLMMPYDDIARLERFVRTAVRT